MRGLDQQKLRLSELVVLERFRDGEEADLTGKEPVRASFLRELCGGGIEQGGAASEAAGLRLRHARVEDEHAQEGAEGNLDLTGLQLGFALWLRDCELPTLILTDTHVLTLNLAGSTCAGIVGDRLSVERGLFLSRLVASGRVWLPDASVGGDLNCIAAHFVAESEARSALLLNGARIGGRLFLRNSVRDGREIRRFKSEGRIQAISVRIEGALVCHNGVFSNPDGRALDFSYARVGSGGSFPNCCIDGEVKLSHASFGGPVSFKGARMAGELNLLCLSTGAGLHLAGLKEVRSINLAGANVGGNLDLNEASLAHASRVDLAGATVSGALRWRDVRYNGAHKGPQPPSAPEVSLADTSVAFLDDEPRDWPQCHRLTLEGLSYERISIETPVARPWYEWRRDKENPSWLARRLEWLRSQPTDGWSPQPYERLAAALRLSGHESAARKVSIERERERRRRGGLGSLARGLNWFLGITLGHGYRPVFALLWALGFITLGWLALDMLLEPGDFTTRDNAPPFSPFGYSLDAFLPIVNLHQEEARVPKEMGWNVALWVHVALGWLFTTLAVAGVTGLVRKE
jgi:hypothetical protein